MACRIIIPNWVMFFMLVLFMESQVLILGKQQVPCMFFLGDSLSDNGNNNFLASSAKANYLPYGIDYPGGPTGGFSNGKMVPDYFAELLGFARPVPPFSITVGGASRIKGVNYASASAGIFDATGIQVGDRISMNRQLLNHRATIASLLPLLGQARLEEHLNKCLYVINMGSNDYLANFILPLPPIRIPSEQFAQILFNQYAIQLKDLYNLGARKVAVFGLGGVTGCIPQLLATSGRTPLECARYIDIELRLFNNRLKMLVNAFNSNLPAANFTYINIPGISLGLLSIPGLVFYNPCCVVLVTGVCVPLQLPCLNRNQHVFFDNFHPTQIVSHYIAARAYKALSPTDAYPLDIRHLVK